MSIQYLSHEWYVREVERLGQQNLNLERYRMDVQRRNWMLVEYMAKLGVPLDEIGMRKDYVIEQARLIRLDDEARRLEDFRRAMVMVFHEAEAARGKVDDSKILDAVLKAIRRNLDSEKKSMSIEAARAQAEKSVASIPEFVPKEAL